MLGIIIILGAAFAAGFVLLKEDGTPEPSPINDGDEAPQNGGGEIPTDEGEEEDEEPLPIGNATVVRTIATNQKVVVLTFDAGADRGFAAQILDTLAAEGIKATFGMTGKWAEQNPDLTLRMANEGHDFINHTWSHRSFTGFSTNAAPPSSKERFDELRRTENIIRDLTGVSTKPFFRPPYGDYDNSVNTDIYAQGYTYNVMWTVDSLGWKGLSEEEITSRVVQGTVPGAIHLFHVGAESQDAAALDDIIRELRSRGYTFARLSDLL